MAIKQILGPLPGIFYRRPSPSDAAYKKPGDTVAAGETIGLIEVMKSFMAVETTEPCRFVRFLVEDGTAVDTDQPVAEME